MGQSSRGVPAEDRSGCPFLDNFDLDILRTVPVTGQNPIRGRFSGRLYRQLSFLSQHADQ